MPTPCRFLESVFGANAVAPGVDEYGQSGSRQELYGHHQIDVVWRGSCTSLACRRCRRGTRRESPSLPSSTISGSASWTISRTFAKSSDASPQGPWSSHRLMQRRDGVNRAPHRRRLLSRTPTAKTPRGAAVRHSPPWPAGGARRRTRAPKARWWPPTGPTPAGHRPSRGGQ